MLLGSDRQNKLHSGRIYENCETRMNKVHLKCERLLMFVKEKKSARKPRERGVAAVARKVENIRIRSDTDDEVR